MTWQLQEAKQRFSELVRRALEEGPQVVTQHGEAVVVVVPAGQWAALQAPRVELVDFLLDGPELSDLDLARSADQPREVGLV